MRAFSGLAALAAALPVALGKLEYLVGSLVQDTGVAMSGIDWGCDIDGTCPAKGIQVPLAELGGADSAGQMKHFVKDDNMNIFRIPVSWQFLTNDKGGTDFDDANWANFQKLMQACLDTGAYCMIDMHNFARYDGSIIGQGGVPDESLVALWSKIAKTYSDTDKVVYGVMNEPHDLEIKPWVNTVQKVVTGIRKAGATDSIILLPGANFTSALTFVSSDSADLLNKVTNPDGSTKNLVMDLHQYLDINNSGTHEECTTDNVDGYKIVGDWLRKNKRTAIVSESGASMDPSCMTRFCAQNEYLADNTDVFIGFIGWAAGGFDTTYMLTLTPTHNSDGSWTDNKLMKECILKPFLGKLDKPTETSTKTHKPAQTSATSTDTPLHDGSENTKPQDTSKKDKDNAAGRTSTTSVTLVIGAAALLFALF
ncbi:hypothetical protein Golomagni_05725 [Golovinomyces magnicellulatus]|nr:hypothetical protein Golomagni_05725 [Golovinomyces magnicellulatus]